jgi:hypothetical protein
VFFEAKWHLTYILVTGYMVLCYFVVFGCFCGCYPAADFLIAMLPEINKMHQIS